MTLVHARTLLREEVQNREEGEIGVKKVGTQEKMKGCGSREIRMRRSYEAFFNLRDDKGCGMGNLTSIRSPWVSWDSLGRT